MTITRRESKNLRHKMRRKRRHIRQLVSRMNNQYKDYISKMNRFEYNTWLSQISDQTEYDTIYKNQVKFKEQILKDIKLHRQCNISNDKDNDKEKFNSKLNKNTNDINNNKSSTSFYCIDEDYLIIDEAINNQYKTDSNCLIC